MLELKNRQNIRPLEIWGGVECTTNRVGEQYFHQLDWNGHAERLQDLDLFAELGMKALRYPILWERIAPDGLQTANWQWADERLKALRQRNIRPIVGLMHHGSGPQDTSLIDPLFPQKLAQYARAVAERYPWLEEYTPVNEPLTTARFAGLYGFWYPHARDPHIFLQALLNQIRGIQLAMQAIRAVNPAAKLVQTEDLGKVYSTAALQYQADFENARRWLTFDLLCGKIGKGLPHPLYDYFQYIGVDNALIETIRAEAIAPDVLGLDYYVTSERFLDDRLHLYPEYMHGGNGRDRYVDIEAVRAYRPETLGHAGILRETWERYHLPLALTEVHIGGTREQQLRWLMEAWQAVNAARKEGVDLRAITFWALLGSFNWDTLVTADQNHYEGGVYDIRSGQPRPTILARAVKSLAQDGRFSDPLLDAPGWWRTPYRLLYQPYPEDEPATAPLLQPAQSRKPTARPLLITGSRGTLGQAFQRICDLRGIAYIPLAHEDLDITDEDNVARLMTETRPWGVINAAGYVRVDKAEQEPDQCWRANVLGPSILAANCQKLALPFLSFSSDLVFDGSQTEPYIESARPTPLNVYGSSKAESEASILANHPRALVVRTSAFFGPWDQANFPVQVLNTLRGGQAFAAAGDVWISPTYVPDLVHACLDLFIDGEHGIWHMANLGAVTWFDFALQVAARAELPLENIQETTLEALPFAAPRPRYSVLGSERALLLPDLADALFRFQRDQQWTTV
ncbi:MAG TPA: family 1 glycosylhydrolase [Anaerolineaceae bacterium]